MIQSLPQFILPIQMERSPERLTSLAGLVLVEELARGLGIWERIEELMEGPQSGAGYQPSEFVQPLVWMLPGGGRRREDLGELREERGSAGTGIESWVAQSLRGSKLCGLWKRTQKYPPSSLPLAGRPVADSSQHSL